MAKQSKKKKRPTDLNLLAASIVDEATNNQPTIQKNGKNLHVVALGCLGGKKGGRARVKKLT
ncbi:MAG: histone H1, partial [Pseudomonadota bacterium]